MKKLNRKSIRLKGYDYSREGAYFVTICAQNRECLFGEIVDDKMVLNKYGEIVKNEWQRTGDIRPNIETDCFVVMPNHVHGIINIRRGVLQYAPTNGFKSPSQTIGAITRGFKSTTTKQINILRDTHGQCIWQRNYYEHIIRGEKDYNRIHEYIQNNPLKWELDSLHPMNGGNQWKN